MNPSILTRIDARDRALFMRFAMPAVRTRGTVSGWRALTHVGGARGSISVCLLTLLASPVTIAIVWRALLVLGISHVVVQLVKRTVGRPRPSVGLSVETLIGVPDMFSFPSGHSCAAMSVAAVYAWTFPATAVPLLTLALAVGFSRVRLGVHYPGDVLAGQAIALVTAFVMCRSW